ncbi:hypothetical protein FRC15_009441 [Serendipita sp. 397]|nr:hypothetical protein FRC15_009441 [Serendipita sp. 397]
MMVSVQLFLPFFLFLSWSPFSPLVVLARPTTNLGSSLVRRGYDPADPRLPPAVNTVCPGGLNATTVDDSTSFGADGDVTLTIGSCQSSTTNATTTTTTTSSSSTNDDSPSGLSSRQFCRTAPNDCVRRFGTVFQSSGFVQKCGATCNSACYPGSGGPDPNDCEHIIAAFATEQAQLFKLEIVTKYFLFTYKSCGIGIHNTIAASTNGCSRTMVYDYVDLGAVARYLAWNCQGAQGAKGGRCTGTTGVYIPQVPDFYIE